MIPDSVTSIGYGAFSECSSLNRVVVIPSGVTSIGDGAFSECSKLKSITVPQQFEGGEELKRIFGVNYVERNRDICNQLYPFTRCGRGQLVLRMGLIDYVGLMVKVQARQAHQARQATEAARGVRAGHLRL